MNHCVRHVERGVVDAPGGDGYLTFIFGGSGVVGRSAEKGRGSLLGNWVVVRGGLVGVEQVPQLGSG